MRLTTVVFLLALPLIAILLSAACGNSQSETSDNAERESPEWSVESADWNVVLATPDLGVGVRRFAFVLSSAED